MDNIRLSMTYLARRSSRSIFVAMLSSAICAVGSAQAMPGYRAPTDMVDGAVMAVTGACYLASAGRPVPGINTPAGGHAGEGITERTSAPDWVSKASDAPGRSKFSTLTTPEGDIWIRFDEATRKFRAAIMVPPDAPTPTVLSAPIFDTAAQAETFGRGILNKAWPETDEARAALGDPQ